MKRIPEPELMDEIEQAKAYSEADFEEPHNAFVEKLVEKLGTTHEDGMALDLGCGPADVSVRFAKAHSKMIIHGVDGAPNMVRLGEARIKDARLSDRIHLMCGYLPGAKLPRQNYNIIFSNSLLHHLKDPMALWEAIDLHSEVGTHVFVMDLCRPESTHVAQEMVETYAANEPEVLRKDFYYSLCASYRPEEVQDQLDASPIEGLTVEALGDRHLIVWGRTQ